MAADEVEQSLDGPVSEGERGMADGRQRRRVGPRVEDVVETDCGNILGNSKAGLAQLVDRTQARQIVAGDEGREVDPAGEQLSRGRSPAVVVMVSVGNELLARARPRLLHRRLEGLQPIRTVAGTGVRARDKGDAVVAVLDQMANRLANPARIVNDHARTRSPSGGEDNRHRCP